MSVAITEQENCTIVLLEQDLRHAELEEIREALLEIVDNSRVQVILRMPRIKAIDSSGIALLITGLHRARKANKLLILCELEPNVEQVFQLTNMDRVFNVTRSLEEAIERAHPPDVFLFEDRNDIVYFYEEVIQANHMRFHHRCDLEESMEFLSRHPVSLLLIDATAQEEMKYELLRRMKTDVNLARIPVVVISVYEDEEFNFSQFGIDCFMLKPFRLEEFIATVRKLLTDSEKR
jgi:anti-sigma B factor antagonist